MQVLCYYAYPSLFLGNDSDNSQRADALGFKQCLVKLAELSRRLSPRRVAYRREAHRSLVASAAPSTSAASFAHCTSGWTRIICQPCEKPQSVLAMRFSLPTTLA